MSAERMPLVVGADPLAVAEVASALAGAAQRPACLAPWGVPSPEGAVRGVWGAPGGELRARGPLYLARAAESPAGDPEEVAWWHAVRRARPEAAALWMPAEPESGWGALDGFRLHEGRVPAEDGAEPYLSRVAEARRARPARLGYGVARRGAEAIAAGVAEALRHPAAPDLIWVDALAPEDLDAAALALSRSPWPLVPVGGPAFAAALGAAAKPGAPVEPAPAGWLLRPEGPVLTLIGSARTALLAQLPIVAPGARVVRYPVEEALLGREEALAGFERAVGAVLAGKQDVVVALHLPGTPDRAAISAWGEAAGVGRAQSGALIGARLAESARRWSAGGGLRAIVSIGRETGKHLLAALKPALRLDPAASAGVGRAVWRAEGGTRLLLAPGRLGGPETLASWHATLRRLPDEA